MQELKMKLLWLTDIHLNFLDETQRLFFYQDIVKIKNDGLIISGDIAEASSVAMIMQEMSKQINKPVYFVLGNHDYYGGDINQVRAQMRKLMQTEPLLHWLPGCGVMYLERDIALIGQDGWADGRLGDYHNSSVVLNDSRMIADLFQRKILGKYNLLKKMQQLADEDANQLKKDLEDAIRQCPKKIVVVTHVPPFKEACLFEGKISGEDYLPFFSSKATGDVLMHMVCANPAIQFLVLCGHTHHECFYQAFDNLIIRVGGVDYSHPKVQDTIHLGVDA